MISLDPTISPDAQEALSYAYVVKQTVVRLRSGNYAVFGHYNYGEGRLPLLHIGPWSELEPFVVEYVPPAKIERPAVVPKALANLNLDLDL